MTWSTLIVYIVGVLSLPALFLGMYLARKGKDIYETLPKDL